MEIKNLTIKNFKSFGNSPQTLTLSNNLGELILLSGKNGSGKSSIIDSIDYVLYNKVKGKAKKYVKLASIPNRINKNLEVEIEFRSGNNDIKVVRGQNPKKLELWENGTLNKKAGARNIEKLITKYVGMELEGFKSFISMSINDFKNFMHLTTEEKKLLLDKLFNLEVIDILNDILKNLTKDNKKDLDLVNNEINILSDNIENINISINKIKDKKEENIKGELLALRGKIENLIEKIKIVKEKIIEIEQKKETIEAKIDDEKKTLYETKFNIKGINEKLNLFNNEQCPTCQANLKSEFHTELKKSFEDSLCKMKEVETEIISKGIKLNQTLIKAKEVLKRANDKYSELNGNFLSLKNEYTKKSNDLKNLSNSEDLIEFNKTIEKFTESKNVAVDKKIVLQSKQDYHKILSNIFGKDGIKKVIIRNIIIPINKYIEECMSILGMPFEVELDETFSAKIYEFGEEIDIDTLSTGETKKINISILIAYLKLIRTKKQINVLFLDEVFSSVDVESINDVIKLIRSLANDYNINIFLVHHSILNADNFDKILNVEKNVFTNLNIIK